MFMRDPPHSSAAPPGAVRASPARSGPLARPGRALTPLEGPRIMRAIPAATPSRRSLMQTLSTPPAAQRDPDLAQADPAIYEAIQQEQERQRMKIELIASENYVSKAVLEAQGSVLTNKYAEGYPGKRYYGGCEYVDIAERLAIERALELFGADHANVQPHSGAQANMAAYMAVMQPGDTLLGMSLAHGGHLTHGYKINFSGQLY